MGFHETFFSWKAHSVHFQMRCNRPYCCKYLPRYFNKHAIWSILFIFGVQRWVKSWWTYNHNLSSLSIKNYSEGHKIHAQACQHNTRCKIWANHTGWGFCRDGCSPTWLHGRHRFLNQVMFAAQYSCLAVLWQAKICIGAGMRSPHNSHFCIILSKKE